MRLQEHASRRWSVRRHRLYLRQRRADHRVIAVGHGDQPQYSRKTQRLLARLYR